MADGDVCIAGRYEIVRPLGRGSIAMRWDRGTAIQILYILDRKYDSVYRQ
jgi:hypothetical protein